MAALSCFVHSLSVTFDTFHWKHDDQPLNCQGHVSFRQTLDPSIGGTASATQQLPPDL